MYSYPHTLIQDYAKDFFFLEWLGYTMFFTLFIPWELT